MPMYEFRCEACSERFEELVPVGTQTTSCPSCGARDTRRILSAQANPLDLVKTASERRKRELRNAELRRSTRDAFKSRRQRVREARGQRRGGRA